MRDNSFWRMISKKSVRIRTSVFRIWRNVHNFKVFHQNTARHVYIFISGQNWDNNHKPLLFNHYLNETCWILGKNVCSSKIHGVWAAFCCSSQEVCPPLLCVLWAHNACAGSGGDRSHRGPGPWLPRAVLPLRGEHAPCGWAHAAVTALPSEALNNG